jgi:two-component system NtrC family response regulator
LLLKYSYPGNVRELENIIHHSIVLSRNELITAEDLPSVLRSRMSEAGSIADDSSLTMTEQVDNLEKRLVFAALEKMGKNQTRAAEMLGISERNLRYRLEKWGYKK